MTTREEDFVEHLFVASTHSYILFFSDWGKVYWLKVHGSPRWGPRRGGKAIVNLLPMEPGESISAYLAGEGVQGRAASCSWPPARVWVKKTDLMAFSRPWKSRGHPGDLVWTRGTS